MSNNRDQFGNATTPVVAPIVAWKPIGYTQITVGGAAVGLGSGSLGAIPVDTIMALIEVEAAAIRWRDDGTPPTANVGMPLYPNQEFQYSVAGGFSQIQFIAQSGTATLNVTFYK